jgi:hypothetical protein
MHSIPEFPQSGNRRPPPITITPCIIRALDVQLAASGITAATVARCIGLDLNRVSRSLPADSRDAERGHAAT